MKPIKYFGIYLVLLLMIFRIDNGAAESLPNVASKTPTNEKTYSSALMYAGISLTTVGALGTVAGLGLGVTALHLWSENGWGESDGAAMLGFPALATLIISTVVVAAGIPMLVIGKQRRNKSKILSAIIPRPSMSNFVNSASDRLFCFQWNVTF